MTLVFLGTRGYVDARTRAHRMHASLLVVHRGRRVMIDCGDDWAGRAGRLHPEAIVVTHAHPDHAGGLRAGSPCPVYATADSWRVMDRFPIPARHRRVVAPGRLRRIAGIGFEAFAVVHSLRAPAVGYRLRAGRADVFYAPDVLAIPERARALGAADLYVGDGASIVRPIVRGRGGRRIGHASVREQLAWCRGEGVRQAVFTHCGSQIVTARARAAEARVAALGRALGLDATIACDGMVLRRGRGRYSSGGGRSGET